MAEMMVCREVNFHVPKGLSTPKEVLLRVENLSVKNQKGVLGVRNLSFEVKAGEILGICGIDGNGQTELVQAITGLVKAEAGKIYLRDREISVSRLRKGRTSAWGIYRKIVRSMGSFSTSRSPKTSSSTVITRSLSPTGAFSIKTP